jgi:5-(carboxyamino)imidazole ribonucleotide synthase
MECFVTDHGLLINELAPRVHNSGHWTLRSEATSQFENHLRAVTGLEPGSTRINGCDAIINILGEYDREATLAALSGDASLTDYDKRFAPGRKVGHINVSGRCRETVLEQLARLHCVLYERGAQPRANRR